MSERLLWDRPRTAPHPGPLFKADREFFLSMARERGGVRVRHWTLNQKRKENSMRGLRSLLKVIALSALAVMVIVGALLVLSPPAAANVTQVVVNQTTVLGNNIEVVGFMEGTAPGGSYSVPVTLLYPISGGSGVGLVDVVNSAAVLAGLPGSTDAS